MVAGDIHAADTVDTAYHKMDSAVRSHRFYKSVQSPVIGEQLVLKYAEDARDFTVACNLQGK